MNFGLKQKHTIQKEKIIAHYPNTIIIVKKNNIAVIDQLLNCKRTKRKKQSFLQRFEVHKVMNGCVNETGTNLTSRLPRANNHTTLPYTKKMCAKRDFLA